jgi:hypothetical protein
VVASVARRVAMSKRHRLPPCAYSNERPSGAQLGVIAPETTDVGICGATFVNCS